MIRKDNILLAAEIAYKHNEFFDFLTGRKGYNLPIPEFSDLIPTDWTRVIPQGIHQLYVKTKDENIITQFEDALKRMMDNSAFDMWCAVYSLFIQRGCEEEKESPFVLNKNLISGIIPKINGYRAELEKEFPYGPRDVNMYQDILRLNNNFKSDYGYSFLGSK